MPEPIQLLIAGIVLCIATITDLKTREVPDTLNYSLIALGFAYNAFASSYLKDPTYIAQSLAGFLIFLVFGCALYYTGQWGGGDTKLLMGLGALFGIQLSLTTYMLQFVIAMFLGGAIYGILWSISLAIMNRRAFQKQMVSLLKTPSVKYTTFLSAIILLLSLPFLFTPQRFIILIPLIISLTYLLALGVKAVERGCMIKKVPVSQLTEGDWLAKPVKHKGKIILKPNETGLTKKHLTLLKRYEKNNLLKSVIIKEGIPFVPSFLFAFIITLFTSNILVDLATIFI